MTRIQSNYTGTITGGPPLSAADTLDADAYEKSNIAVPDGANVTVDVMPAVADALQLLIIKPDKSGLANLTFKVNDAASAALPLDHPQLFSGGERRPRGRAYCPPPAARSPLAVTCTFRRSA
jgi:hypothetical protein